MRPYRNAQALIEMLKKDNQRKGLKEMIVNEVLENRSFDLEDTNVVENIIEKIREFVQETKWSRNMLLANEFGKFEQKSEANKDYVSRFSSLETKLKNEGTGIKDRFLAAVLLNKSRISQPEKNNILANFNLDTEPESDLLKKIKAKIRDLDVTREVKKIDSKETLYGNYDRRRSRSRSHSNGRNHFRQNSNDRSRSRMFSSRDGTVSYTHLTLPTKRIV